MVEKLLFDYARANKATLVVANDQIWLQNAISKSTLKMARITEVKTMETIRHYPPRRPQLKSRQSPYTLNRAGYFCGRVYADAQPGYWRRTREYFAKFLETNVNPQSLFVVADKEAGRF